MVNKEDSNQNIDIDINEYKITTENVEFVMNFKKIKNPAELLEKLYLLRENQTLTNAEKNEMVKRIMLDYMGWFFWKISGTLYYLIYLIKLIQLNVPKPT